MKKLFVPYEIALALKELGFDETCFGYYGIENELKIEVSSNLDTNLARRNFYTAPTFSQAFKFFREKYNMKFYILEDIWNHWCTPRILDEDTDDYEEFIGSYETMEEAEQECLIKLIEITKEKK